MSGASLCLLALLLVASSLACCEIGQACWPTQSQISAFYQELSPGNRTLWWEGDGFARVSAVPGLSEDEQPLYGDGVNMEPLYQQQTSSCFGKGKEFCHMAVRNAPYDEWNPAFVVWPLTASDVQTSLTFARAHDLCVCVAGTGHDFLNRHSCEKAGIFIRMALFKMMDFDLSSGTVEVGAGIVFSELHEAAAQHNLYVASGWASTVGVVGWSIGGGHGPFAPSSGLGVDNILAAKMVLADGSLVTVSPKENADLYWALRGGGGSIWGVIISLTLRTHKVPQGGFTEGAVLWAGSMCGAGLDKLHSIMDAHFLWQLSLGTKWAGLTFITPDRSANDTCPSWSIYSDYVYMGSASDEEWISKWDEQLSEGRPVWYKNVTSYTNWWQRVQYQALEPIWNVPWLNGSIGGVPSVAVSREHVSNGSLSAVLRKRLTAKEHWGRQEFYHDITGNVGSVQDPNVSVNAGMRSSIFHFVFGGATEEVASLYYSLGEHSYFGESAFQMNNWQHRLWGQNYFPLLSIKEKYDPSGLFWCRHCIGSE